MKGHIRKRGSKWSVIVDIGRGPKIDRDGNPVLDANGKPVMVRKQREHSGFDLKREAEEALPGILDQGKIGASRKQPKNVAEYLVDVWLPAAKIDLRASTHDSYRRNIERYVVPTIGGIRLRQLTGADLNRLYADLLERGGRDGQGLSPRSIRYVHAIVSKALNDAVDWNYVYRSAADQARPPKQARNHDAIRVWTKPQLDAFLDHVRVHDDRLYAMWHLLAATGMRRGEAIGLSWDAIDLEAGRVTVKRALVAVGYEPEFSEPKTERGRRSIGLDQRTVEVLRAHAEQQAAEMQARGDEYEDHGLVFCRPNGDALHPDRVSKLFAAHVKASALPRIRLHDLRHTHATLLKKAGVDLLTISRRLGHAGIAITADTYTHDDPAADAAAAEAVAALIE